MQTNFEIERWENAKNKLELPVAYYRLIIFGTIFKTLIYILLAAS